MRTGSAAASVKTILPLSSCSASGKIDFERCHHSNHIKAASVVMAITKGKYFLSNLIGKGLDLAFEAVGYRKIVKKAFFYTKCKFPSRSLAVESLCCRNKIAAETKPDFLVQPARSFYRLHKD